MSEIEEQPEQKPEVVIAEQPEAAEEVEDNQPAKDYAKIYVKYLDRYNKAYATSVNLCTKEKNQRIALSYYIRRNNALLSILNELEPTAPETSVTTSDRIKKIIETAPRLSKVLNPLIDDGDATTTIKQNHLLNCILVEQIPDLINDDLINSEVNPQDMESWCRRHYPNLVSSKYKPLNVQNSGVVNEYTGIDFPLIDHEGNIDRQATNGVTKKKRRLK
ncbi:hypothetical protein JA1_000933 [Spathaspora sp. JA1]|nr:hypothetical protein JA1_000933 [Spathaspora sp. JA1]